jgi:hypothetical protein
MSNRPILPLIVSVRAADLPPSFALPAGVERRPCAVCKEAILLAPSSLALLNRGQAVAVCNQCATKMYEKNPPSFIGIFQTQAQAREEQAFRQMKENN